MASTSYEGSCHCGSIRYRANLDLDQPVVTCNCSMCQRSGSMLSFVPQTQFELISGESNLQDYQFGKKHIHHMFCKTCGIRPFGKGTGPDGVEMIAVNVRCLEQVGGREQIDLEPLSVHKYDGRSL